ncbi:MAG TPA: CocE/NonD family hydrolase [Roseiflexaceae bacterium]|nr:CocE/NonD family hydrolase [Roseiflexaceae bacterium]
MPNLLSVEFDVPATMRDGTVLRANVFRPAGGGLYPVALCRTPYNKDFATVQGFLDAPRLARAGYIVVIQDVRGRAASEGAWSPLAHEYEDGYDTVEWAARLPGSSGAVGMFGISYLGFTQWAAALAGPPSLRAIVPGLTWARANGGLTFRGGAFELGTAAAWQLGAVAIDAIFRRMRNAPPQEVARALADLAREIDALRTSGYGELPLAEFGPLRRVGVGTEFLEYVARGAAPDSFSPFPSPEAYARVTVPSLNIGGWYDLFIQGTIDNFLGTRAHGATPEARHSRLLIGPWSHVNYGGTVGEQDFGFAAQAAFMKLETDVTGLTQRWFDYWLKGIDNGVASEPPVRVFVLGQNAWRDMDGWPPQSTQTPFYLRASGGLVPEPPGDEPPDAYVYDPTDPTPTRGGPLLMHPLFVPGAADQRPIEARPDVLSYTSAPLDRDLEVAGRVSARLWAASDAPDTDFVARLVDVHPDGFAQFLADGIVRARAALGAPLEPGRPYELVVDMWSVANVFRAGHRVRLDICSASFPRWDRTLNTLASTPTLADARPARQTIFHDAARPSCVLLPVRE